MISGSASRSRGIKYGYDLLDRLDELRHDMLTDMFHHDRLTGSTVLVSANSAGTPGAGASENPEISDDGQTVLFFSNAPDLPGGRGDAKMSAFLWRRK